MTERAEPMTYGAPSFARNLLVTGALAVALNRLPAHRMLVAKVAIPTIALIGTARGFRWGYKEGRYYGGEFYQKGGDARQGLNVAVHDLVVHGADLAAIYGAYRLVGAFREAALGGRFATLAGFGTVGAWGALRGYSCWQVEETYPEMTLGTLKALKPAIDEKVLTANLLRNVLVTSTIAFALYQMPNQRPLVAGVSAAAVAALGAYRGSLATDDCYDRSASGLAISFAVHDLLVHTAEIAMLYGAHQAVKAFGGASWGRRAALTAALGGVVLWGLSRGLSSWNEPRAERTLVAIQEIFEDLEPVLLNWPRNLLVAGLTAYALHTQSTNALVVLPAAAGSIALIGAYRGGPESGPESGRGGKVLAYASHDLVVHALDIAALYAGYQLYQALQPVSGPAIGRGVQVASGVPWPVTLAAGAAASWGGLRLYSNIQAEQEEEDELTLVTLEELLGKGESRLALNLARNALVTGVLAYLVHTLPSHQSIWAFAALPAFGTLRAWTVGGDKVSYAMEDLAAHSVDLLALFGTMRSLQAFQGLHATVFDKAIAGVSLAAAGSWTGWRVYASAAHPSRDRTFATMRTWAKENPFFGNISMQGGDGYPRFTVKPEVTNWCSHGEDQTEK